MQPVPLSQRDINKTLSQQVDVPIPLAYFKLYESDSWFWDARHWVDLIASSPHSRSNSILTLLAV